MNTITRITGVYPIQLTNSSGPEVFIQCKGDEIARALRELTDRIHVLESQVNNLTTSHSELQANYWETEAKVDDLENTLSRINVNLRDDEGNFRSTEVVLNDLSEKWDELDDAQQFATKQSIAGMRNQSAESVLDASIAKLERENDYLIFNQNLQQILGNIGITAQEAYTALEDMTKWLGEIK